VGFVPRPKGEEVLINNLRRKLDSASRSIARVAKSNAPVKTGRLRGSIGIIPAELVGDQIVGGIEAGGDGVDYEVHVEFTNVPFMGQSVPSAIEALKKLGAKNEPDRDTSDNLPDL
jgi:hypothetical protein